VRKNFGIVYLNFSIPNFGKRVVQWGGLNPPFGKFGLFQTLLKIPSEISKKKGIKGKFLGYRNWF